MGQLAIAVQDIHTDSASAPTTIRAGFLAAFQDPGYGPSVLFPKQRPERGHAEGSRVSSELLQEIGAITTIMGATNKCLAQGNKSRTAREATNKWNRR